MPAPPAHAALFYSGGVVIDSCTARIDVTDRAEVALEYELVNRGDAAETLTLSFFPESAEARIDGGNLSNPVSFDPGVTHRLTLSYSLALADAGYQTLLFAPTLLLDDTAIVEKVSSYEVTLILPEGVSRATFVSMPYDRVGSEDGRVALIWEMGDTYLTPLSVSWSGLDVDIAATKTATPSSLTATGETVEVRITVENRGPEEVRDITLEDDFQPLVFEAVSPLYEFRLEEPELSDPHLYWSRSIDSLQPGEVQSFAYSVKPLVLGQECRLGSLVVTVSGIPVSVSNDVVLSSQLDETYGAEAGEEGFPLAYVIVGAVAVVVIVAVGLLITLRRPAR